MKTYGQGRSALSRLPRGLSIASLSLIVLCSSARAADKPPFLPDTLAPLTTQTHLVATMEFGLPALAAEIEKAIPRRLATIDERVNCIDRKSVV